MIVDLSYAISSKMLGPTGLKDKKKSKKWFVHSF